MKKLFASLAALFTVLFSSFAAAANTSVGLMPNTGEDYKKMFLFVGLMAIALVAIIVIVIIRNRRK